jgi:exodeoxyribonuclease VII large subunit
VFDLVFFAGRIHGRARVTQGRLVSYRKLKTMSEIRPLTPLGNLPEYTVSEISQAVKRTLENSFERVRVRGELSGFKRHSSGHCYFTLKDADAAMDGVCWRGTALRLGIKPEDGMEVIVTGRITTYPGRSKYQIVIDAMELAGEGALLKMIEDRRKRLAAEGLFDPARTRPLPFLPEVIGVITSPTGAVIRDIVHRLTDRFPRHVLLWPVPVQGDGAAEQVAAAIAGFNALPGDGKVPRPDVLIVARGGGSLEDLMPFNEEIVVRAAAASAIPLIAAVGHETDTTLIDYAADRRAPTPTAAAEMAVPVRAELLANLQSCGQRLVAALARTLDERRARVDGLARGLGDPQRLVDDFAQRLDDWSDRLKLGLANWLQQRRSKTAESAGRLIAFRANAERLVERETRHTADLGVRLQRAAAAYCTNLQREFDATGKLLESFSYRSVLARGFALVTDALGHAVQRAAETRTGMSVRLRFYDDTVGATVKDGAPKRPKAEPAPPAKQDKLL